MRLAPNCPQCNKRLSWFSRKKNPFPCPSCGTRIAAEFPSDGFVMAVIVWCVLSIPLYVYLWGIFRIAADLALLVLILSVVFSRYGLVSIATDDTTTVK